MTRSSIIIGFIAYKISNDKLVLPKKRESGDVCLRFLLSAFIEGASLK